MPILTSPRRPATRSAMPSMTRNRVVQAVVRGVATFTGHRHRDNERALARFEQLDLDQRVREIGEW